MQFTCALKGGLLSIATQELLLTLQPSPHGLDHGIAIGYRSIILKFSYAHQDASMEYTSNEWKGVHLHTLVDRERKRSKNGDDVVEHDVIRITDDRVPNGRHLRVQHTYGAATSPPS